MSRPTIVAVCGDPGGAVAVAPVIHELQNAGRATVRPYAYRQAIDQWRRRNIDVVPLDENGDEQTYERILVEQRAELLLMGTSVNGVDLEKRFVAAARRCHVPSLAVLDFWSSYRRRFADAAGALAFLPDRIAIMDEQARAEMVAEGIESERLAVTGSPAFSDVAAWRAREPQDLRAVTRRALGVPDGEALIVFASQPLTEMCGPSGIDPAGLDYTEFSVIELIIAAMETLACKGHQPIHLLIRPHPRETVDKYRSIKGRRNGIIVSAQHDARAVIRAADLVAGMDSAFLVESCYLGAPTISLQPGLTTPDALPTNRFGFSAGIYCAEEVAPAIERLLFDQVERSRIRERLREFIPDPEASRRVADLAGAMLDGRRPNLAGTTGALSC